MPETYALIGNGAIARYVRAALECENLPLAALLMRAQRLEEAGGDNVPWVSTVTDLPAEVSCVIDCAGHAGLAQHGAAALRSGRDVITVSLGALADADLAAALTQAGASGDARLHLATGAIGALDALRAGAVGELTSVRYTGRKPPAGWKDSPAEEVINLDSLTHGAATHFEGTAGEAARCYPKNANVAAAVALAGLGFEETQAQLIADPDVTANIHEIEAEGDFGRFTFRIEGRALPDNPKSSALAAMSVVAALRDRQRTVHF